VSWTHRTPWVVAPGEQPCAHPAVRHAKRDCRSAAHCTDGRIASPQRPSRLPLDPQPAAAGGQPTHRRRAPSARLASAARSERLCGCPTPGALSRQHFRVPPEVCVLTRPITDLEPPERLAWRETSGGHEPAASVLDPAMAGERRADLRARSGPPASSGPPLPSAEPLAQSPRPVASPAP
jgi:hypothetical protein